MIGSSRRPLCCGLQPDYFVPDPESFSALRAVFLCFQAMPSGAKVLADRPERRQEALGVPDRLEALHDPLAFARGLVRVFGAVIEIPALTMFHARQAVALGRSVAREFVRDQHARRVCAAFEELGYPTG